MRRQVLIGVVSAFLLVVGVGAVSAQDKPRVPQDVCQTLNEERAKFSSITDERQLGEILVRTAWRHRDAGWGVSRKAGGHHVEMPAPVGRIAVDILHRRSDNLIWDVIVAAGANSPSTITCGEALGPMTDPNRPWVAPADLGGGNPPPPPSCADCERKLVEAELKLAQALRDIEGWKETHANDWAQIAELERRNADLARERDEARARADTAEAALANLRCSSKGWINLAGIRIRTSSSCEVIRP